MPSPRRRSSRTCRVSLSDLVYKFDYQSLDRSRAVLGVTKENDGPNGYVDGATWLDDNYPTRAYSVMAHPSRDLRWPIWAIRNFNNAAPTVCFGMAGVPGSQKEPFRGGYDSFFDKYGRGLDEDSPAQMKKVNWAVTNTARTYGGADLYTAKVGGVWDALLGEGRHFWIFADSDFHNTEEEFWPGQYNQDHTWVPDFTQQGIVDGLRAGKSFSAMGGLINELDFTAASGGPAAEMGGTLAASSGSSVTITIRFKSPATNYHGDHAGRQPRRPHRRQRDGPDRPVEPGVQDQQDQLVDACGAALHVRRLDRRRRGLQRHHHDREQRHQRHVLPPARLESRRGSQEPDRMPAATRSST